MKKFILAIGIWACAGCTMQQHRLAWRVKDMALERTPVVGLQGSNEQIVFTLPTRTIQEMTLAYLRVSRTATVQCELYIVEGDEPNAYAGPDDGRRIIAINLGMVKLIGNDANQYAALIGHEVAHWAKGHVDSGRLRANTLNALGTLVGVGLGAAGVPAAGIISGFGVDLIDSSYDRDQEREADALSVDYMIANSYDPAAAIDLQEKLLKIHHGLHLPFLSSHPSGEERIENLKATIAAKTARQLF
jgi:Zn-dependent protease with chaperone function